jgi:hypothetical protein
MRRPVAILVQQQSEDAKLVAGIATWPDRAIVQRVAAQLPWRQAIALLERLGYPQIRLGYAEQSLRHGWSHSIL